MEKKTSALQDFETFAKARLSNHEQELNTRYQNQKIDTATLEKAYSDHQEIFSQELDEKIQALNNDQEDQGLLTALKSQKDIYLNRLTFNQSKN